MGKCTRRRVRGGTLVLKKTDASLRQRVQELGGGKVGVVPVDVSKERICAMVADFYGNVLTAPEVFPITTAGLDLLERRITEAQAKHGLKLMVVGLEQTGRLHEPVRRVLARRWELKLVHPLVTSHLRQGINRNIKTDGADVDALLRAVTGCYGSPCRPLPVAYEHWRALHRVRQQLVDERARRKDQMHERLQAAMPGLSKQFDSVWISPLAAALLCDFDSPAALLHAGESGLRQRLRERGVRCTPTRAEQLVAWAADAVPPGAAATTEMAILRADLEHLSFLGRRLEHVEREMLAFLVQSPFVLLLSIPGISHVLASGLGAEAGPMEFYPTARNLTGRAGLYPRRYQSDQTDLQGTGMACGQPFLRHVLMNSGRCLILPGGAFFAWGESRRALGWKQKEIVAAMANRFCRVVHAMLLTGQTFHHPEAKPGVSVLGKLLNVAADLGIDAPQATAMARQATAKIPACALPVEISDLTSGAWKDDNRPREHGASPCTTRQIARETVPALLKWLTHQENHHDVTPAADFRSP